MSANPTLEPFHLNPAALDALRNGQRQLDEGGEQVGVSRQALDELLAAWDALTPQDGAAEAAYMADKSTLGFPRPPFAELPKWEKRVWRRKAARPSPPATAAIEHLIGRLRHEAKISSVHSAERWTEIMSDAADALAALSASSVAPEPVADLAMREALTDFCRAAEYSAGCDEGVTPDKASSDIMSWAGSWLAVSYDKATALLSAAPADGGA